MSKTAGKSRSIHVISNHLQIRDVHVTRNDVSLTLKTMSFLLPVMQAIPNAFSRDTVIGHFW